MKSTVAVLEKREENVILSQYENQHCFCMEDGKFLFDGRVYSPDPSVSGTQVFVEKLQGASRIKASEAFLKEVDGDFTFIVAEPKRIIAGRDPIGVVPFYYGENSNIAALASNRRALWKLGIEETKSFPPGHLASVSREGFKFKPVRTLVNSPPKMITMREASQTLLKLLEQSIGKRVWCTKEIAVAFSGGLDSSVVAFLASRRSVNAHLIHVSLENRSETEDAKKAAEELKLPLHLYLFREDDVERVVAKVVELIEEPDPVKASIGVPFYWTAEKAARAGFKVILAGQGADELFGGYQRYVNEYLVEGKEKVRKTMFKDVARLHESNIERDEKICGFHDVELRLPFASYELAKFAVTLPLELKIERKADSLRKLVLREVAEKIGLPSFITTKPKKAVQYSTGINGALRRLAKKENATVTEYISKLFLSQLTKEKE
jgi:asparagine synthase (glutamine-hydrolysing)